jgi:ABC-type branched-subunit amino acid transport system substrate-binding protein
MPDSPLNPDSNPPNIQNVTGNQNQVIAHMIGGMVVYGTVICNNAPSESDGSGSQPERTQIGPNPYKGLLAFQETDGDRFFGRETQIQKLWDKFRSLHDDPSAIRLLPIHGPSGSGKSSLVRAGLIPELARRPLQARDHARVAVLVPGSRPLEALATVLARIATNDQTPLAKTNEFTEELKKKNANGEYEGLRRIADMLPDITISPLIVLVDQLEEVYTLCEDEAERDAFIGNLLCAASERSNRVSAIVTLRSDFLGKTQKHPRLNQLIAEQSFFVSAMAEEELKDAILKPAEKPRKDSNAEPEYFLDNATVSRLIEQTQKGAGDGTLPLLQFALFQIWEELEKGNPPATTLTEIGGVGGALAKEAEQVYNQLKTPEERDIARRIFIGLVQFGEGTQDSRRRVLVKTLVSAQDNWSKVQSVIERFARPEVRLITCSSEESENKNPEVTYDSQIEVTHEILIQKWKLLGKWIKDFREDHRQIRHIQAEAEGWEEHGKLKGELLSATKLERMKNLLNVSRRDLSCLANEFYEKSEQESEIQRNQNKTKELLSYFGLTILFIVILGVISFINDQKKREQEAVEQSLLGNQMGIGEKIIVKANTSPLKKAGTEAFSAAIAIEDDFAKKHEYFDSALKKFEQSWKEDNDPESLIYKNNSLIERDRNQKSNKDSKDSYEVVAVVPAGSNPSVAQEMLYGVALVQNLVNNSKNYTQKLTVQIANDDNKCETAKALASKIVKDKKVLAVIGHNASPASRAAAPIYANNGLVMINPTSVIEDLLIPSNTESCDIRKTTSQGNDKNVTQKNKDQYKYIFRIVPKASFFSNYLAKHIIVKNVVIFADSHATDNLDFKISFEESLLKVNPKVKISKTDCDQKSNQKHPDSNANEMSCNLYLPNFNPKIAVEIVKAQHIDKVLLAPHVDRIEKAAEVAEEIQKINKNNNISLLGSLTMHSSETLSFKDKFLGLTLATIRYDLKQKGISPSNRKGQNPRDIPLNFTWRTALSYDATIAIVTGLRLSHEPTPKGLQEALHGLNFKAKGITGSSIEFCQNGERKNAESLLQIVQVQPSQNSPTGYDFIPLSEPNSSKVDIKNVKDSCISNS